MGNEELLWIKESGTPGKPVVVLLHGLLASTMNWQGVTRRLSKDFNFFSVDLPNHGHSPAMENMNYEKIVEALKQSLQHISADKIHLMGHSLGGKVAMLFSLQYPDRIDKLVVEDIAPKEYPKRFQRMLKCMLALDLENLSSRKEADEQMSKTVEESDLRVFMLTNLVQENGKFFWRANIEELDKAADEMKVFTSIDVPSCTNPALFIYGQKSEYLGPADEMIVKTWFPNAAMHGIEGVGHWVHAEKPDEFCERVKNFLD